jgi:hypothetical protein
VKNLIDEDRKSGFLADRRSFVQWRKSPRFSRHYGLGKSASCLLSMALLVHA